MEELKIRIAAPEDAEAIAEIYRPYVEETAVSFEYTAPSAEEMRSRMLRTLENYPYLVAELSGRAAGYAYAGAFLPRPAYAWSVELSIYLERGARRAGLGRALYGAMEGLLRAMNIQNLNACIAWLDEEDEYLTHDSVRFHERRGFKTAARFDSCGWKFGRWYDMIWMEKHIGPHRPQPGPVIPFSRLRAELPAAFEPGTR